MQGGAGRLRLVAAASPSTELRSLQCNCSDVLAEPYDNLRFVSHLQGSQAHDLALRVLHMQADKGEALTSVMLSQGKVMRSCSITSAMILILPQAIAH